MMLDGREIEGSVHLKGGTVVIIVVAYNFLPPKNVGTHCK
jgi:hypothetical protein